ncbi:MAG: hypothetical protein U9N02_00970 [Campylobacterota bacterium]|nr:hypothetical protein [Campylobacterota bacterium]
MITIGKIELNNFRFFIDDEANNTFKPNTKGMLVYGENGSGKTSLYKAFDFLSTPTIQNEEFSKEINIFNQDDTYLEFDFSNDETLRIDSDHLSLDGEYPFIEKLSVSKPIIDYKSLLKISHSVDSAEKKNLYTFFQIILENYPINIDDKKLLKELDDPEIYYEEYKRIIQEELFDDINLFLKKFNHGFKITDIRLSGIGKTAYLEIDYFDKSILTYQNFLNEARLSALAISVYFAIIKKQFSFLEEESLKILILDDLLISLDMNNRLNLVKILQEEFNEFQIFFFTHEKALYDLINEKMNLKAYEIYVTKKDDYEIPFIKQSNTLLEQAIQQKDTYNYGCSANLLRQFTEKILCDYLPKEQTIGAKCKKLNLDSLLTKAKTFEDTKTTNINEDLLNCFIKLKTFKRVLLNNASHYNSTDIYKAELEDAIKTLEELEKIIKILKET